MEIRKGIQLIENGTKQAIIEFVFMKMQGNETLAKKYLQAIQSCWNSGVPLTNNDYVTLKSLIENGENDIDIELYFALNVLANMMLNFYMF